jgi:hypothetical protein
VAFWMTTSASKLISPIPATSPPGTNINAAPPTTLVLCSTRSGLRR